MLRYACLVLLVKCQLAQRSHAFRLRYSNSCRTHCSLHGSHGSVSLSRSPLQFAFYLRYSSSDDNVEAERSNIGNQRSGRLSRPSIPVIGPIPLAPPLMVGDDMIVKQPTPMQWTTFEEARWIHMNSHNMSLVDASPIVAVIDEVTGYKATNSFVTGRYATIAAIMGVQQLQDKDSDEKRGGSYSSFTESSSVRLYGIGRAVLCEFYNRIPSAFTTANTEEDDEDDDDDYDDYTDDDHDNTYLSSGRAPIIMAEFELLYDLDVPKVYDDADTNVANVRRHASAWSANFWSSLTVSSKAMDSILASKYSNTGKILSLSSYNNNYQQNKKKVFDNLGDAYTSPAASIANLARFGGQVNMMHDSRRSLVSGIIAAKRRLQNYYDQVSSLNDYGQSLQPKGGSKWLWNEMTDEWEQDSSSLELEWEQETASLLLEREYDLIGDKSTTSSNEPNDESPENHPTEQEIKSAQYLTMRNGKTVSEMENFGLSYYGAFSSLSSLTDEAMRRFKPYYSSSHREREEYTYEVQSFVAWKALEGIVSPSDVAWCLLCTSAKDRLLRAYDIMYEHRLGLEELVDSLSQELSSCGEECTDLW
jgi:hypothetical protein